MKLLVHLMALLVLLSVSGCVIREEGRGGGYEHSGYGYGHEEHEDHEHWDDDYHWR